MRQVLQRLDESIFFQRQERIEKAFKQIDVSPKCALERHVDFGVQVADGARGGGRRWLGGGCHQRWHTDMMLEEVSVNCNVSKL